MQNMIVLSSLTCPLVVPNLYDFLSSVEKEDTLKNVWVLDPIVLQNVMFYVLKKKERFGMMTKLSFLCELCPLVMENMYIKRKTGKNDGK